MIKKWLVRLFSAAVVVLLVFAVLHRDRYRSLLFDTGEPAAGQTTEQAE